MKILEKLNKRERAILFISAAAILLSLVYILLVEPLVEHWKSLDRQIKLTKVNLQKSLSIIKDKDSIDREYAQYEAQLRSRGSDEQEMTYILNGLERIARASNIKLINIKPKPPQEKEFYRLYLVEIETESDMHSLMKFIFDVKNSPLLLRVDKLNLSSKSSRTGIVIRASMLISKLSLS